ncbi:hypothetical protein Esti_005254 [Eimeria stiedai]
MMDDASDKHLSSTELRTSGMQLLSRGTERAPQQTLTRSPKASPSCKRERGVMAIVVGTLLVVLSGRYLSAEPTAATGKGVTNCLLGFNVSRTAKMDTQDPLLQNDNALESGAVSAVKEAFTDNSP